MNEEKDICVEKTKEEKSAVLIWEYVKKHDAILIAIGTALITAVSTVLKVAGYLFDKAYLKYWGVNEANVQSNEGTLYIVGAAILWVLLMLFSMNKLLAEQDVHFVNLKTKYYYRIYLKRKHLTNDQKTVLKETQENFETNKKKTGLFKAIFLCCISFSFLALIFGIWLIDFNMPTWTWIMGILIILSVAISAIALLIYLAGRVGVRIGAFLQVKYDCRREYINEAYWESINKESKDQAETRWYNVKNAKRLICIFIVAAILILIGSFLLGEYVAQEKRDFSCIEYEDEYYVVIYDADDVLFAAQLDNVTDDGCATIDASRQIRLSAINQVIKKVTFKEVVIEH